MSSYDASDRKQVRAARKISRLRERARLRGLEGLLDSADGRAWLWSLLERCGVHHISFRPSATETAFNEGQRNIGLGIEADLVHHFPDKYVSLLHEHRSIDRSTDERIDSAGGNDEPGADDDVGDGAD